jgi:hypothetical protein
MFRGQRGEKRREEERREGGSGLERSEGEVGRKVRMNIREK